ncbi:hypothetical protein B0H14DRAFT_3897655 [Mycena olivaceomarginata]|nr:hypothetical protein B0H14DRAFT_3897655 [Mycena olivaceomarginata]
MHRLPIARHPSSSIFTLLLPPNVARTTRERPPTAVLSIGAAAGELSPPQVTAEKILWHGAERSNRCKQLRLGLDYTNRPTFFSRPSVHLIYTAQGTGAHLHPVLPAGLFATHLISSRRALPHLDYATMRFRGDAGSGSNILAWRARPSVGSVHPASRPHGAVFEEVRPRCSGDVHAAAWVFGTPQTHAARRAHPYLHPVPSRRPHLGSLEIFCTTPLPGTSLLRRRLASDNHFYTEYPLFEAKLIETSSNHRSFREFGEYFLFVIACRAMRTLHYNLCNLWAFVFHCRRPRYPLRCR